MGDFGDELARLMAARGLGVRELARRVPCNPGYISSLRSGGKQPSAVLAEKLDDVLGGGGSLVAIVRKSEPGGRAVLDELAGQAVEFGQWTETTNVGPGTIEQLDEEIHQIARDYLTVPPGPLISRAAQVSRRVFGLLRGHQRLRYRRDLYVIGAKASAFLAWAAGDQWRLPAAAAQGRAALILADEADHAGARGLALCALSKTAFWAGQRPKARDLARQGYDDCPPTSTRVLLACQEADASDLPAAHEAIGRAVSAAGEITQEDALGGLFGCGQVRLANYLMGIYLRAGESSAALKAAAHAAECGPGEQVGYGTWAQISIGAGIAYLRGGNSKVPPSSSRRCSPCRSIGGWRR
jgi:transcriptional regulator with XRE-family HTH domain